MEPTKRCLGAQDESAEIEVSAGRGTNTPMAVMQPISTELAVAALSFHAEAAKGLRIGLAAHSDHQSKRR